MGTHCIQPSSEMNTYGKSENIWFRLKHIECKRCCNTSVVGDHFEKSILVIFPNKYLILLHCVSRFYICDHLRHIFQGFFISNHLFLVSFPKRLQLMLLNPLKELSNVLHADIRQKQLESVLQILQSQGDSLGPGWPLVLGVIGAIRNDQG